MMLPEAPPLAPPRSLRGAARQAVGVFISALARWPAVCLSVPPRRGRLGGAGLRRRQTRPEQAMWLGHWTQSAYLCLPGPQFLHLCNGRDHPCTAGGQERL